MPGYAEVLQQGAGTLNVKSCLCVCVCVCELKKTGYPKLRTKIGHDISSKYWLNSGPKGGTEEWNISCHIVNNRCHSSAISATTEGKLVSPEGTQEGKNICYLAAIKLLPPPTVKPKEAQDMKDTE